MSSMAITAIDENFSKLKRSHALAKQVGDFCVENGIKLESPVDTNFVFIDLKANRMDDGLLVSKGVEHGLKLMGGRIAFHYQLSQKALTKSNR